MRTSARIGIVSSSVAVIGSAALAALAPGAGAAPGGGASTATATGTSGEVTVNGTAQHFLSVTATPGNSPKSGSVGSAQLTHVLEGVPSVGPALVAAFKTGNPTGTDLVTVSADASSGGTSAACAAVLAADCVSDGHSHPLAIKLGLQDLTGSLPVTALSGVLAGVQNMAGYNLVLTINGPTASCTAGPGGSGMSASDSPVDAVASIQDPTGKQVGPSVPVHGGEVFKQLTALGLPTSLPGSVPLDLTVSPGSSDIAGGKASATAAEVGLSASGTNLFDIKGATVSCGPNSGAGGNGGGNGPGGTGTGTGTASSTSTSHEKPLTGIQTDEGRSAVTSQPWLALNGTP